MYKLKKFGNFSAKLLLVPDFYAELRKIRIRTGKLRILDPNFLNFGRKIWTRCTYFGEITEKFVQYPENSTWPHHLPTP